MAGDGRPSFLSTDFFVLGVVEQDGLDADSRDQNFGAVKSRVIIMISKFYNNQVLYLLISCPGQVLKRIKLFIS